MSTPFESPDDRNTVNGFIVAEDAAGLIGFLTEVFDGTEIPEARTPDWYAGDGTLIHAEVRIGDSVLMVADRKRDWPFTPALTQVYVADAARTLRLATRLGATVVTEVAPFYGGLDIARFLDPWRNLWWLFAPSRGDREPDRDAPDPAEAEPGPVYTTLLDAMRGLSDPRRTRG